MFFSSLFNGFRDFEKLQDEQDRLKRRQNELERLRREVEERQKQLNDEEQRKKKQMERIHHDRLIKLNEFKRNRAALVIQKHYRGYFVRKWYSRYKNAQRMEYIKK
jgi:hypothetical protein